MGEPGSALEPRTFLYVPGDSERKLANGAATGADALILDLEDAVPPAGKAAARAKVRAWLRQYDGSQGGPQLWVRVNSGLVGSDDVEAVVSHGLAGIVVPKCEGLAELEAMDGCLSAAEDRCGLSRGTVAVAALVESARGVLGVASIAGGPRVVRLQLGEADLCGQLGLVPSEDERELLAIRMQVVMASAAYDLRPPTGPVFRRIDDVAGLQTSTAALRRLGFGSRSVIHPKQIAPVHEALRPTDGELAQAQLVIDEFERRVADGSGVYADDSGMLIDEAVVRMARKLVERAAHSPSTGGY